MGLARVRSESIRRIRGRGRSASSLALLHHHLRGDRARRSSTPSVETPLRTSRLRVRLAVVPPKVVRSASRVRSLSSRSACAVGELVRASSPMRTQLSRTAVSVTGPSSWATRTVRYWMTHLCAVALGENRWIFFRSHVSADSTLKARVVAKSGSGKEGSSESRGLWQSERPLGRSLPRSPLPVQGPEYRPMGGSAGSIRRARCFLATPRARGTDPFPLRAPSSKRPARQGLHRAA